MLVSRRSDFAQVNRRADELRDPLARDYPPQRIANEQCFFEAVFVREKDHVEAMYLAKLDGIGCAGNRVQVNFTISENRAAQLSS
jgi:hypothetical protein